MTKENTSELNNAIIGNPINSIQLLYLINC